MGFNKSRFKNLDNTVTKFECKLCSDISEFPVIIQFCENIFCEKCINQYIQSQGNYYEVKNEFDTKIKSEFKEKGCLCPACSSEDQKHYFYPNFLPEFSGLLRKVYNDIEIKCEYESNGCQTICKIVDLIDHQNECLLNGKIVFICDKGCDDFINGIEYKTHNCVNHLKGIINTKTEEFDGLKTLFEGLKERCDQQQKEFDSKQVIITANSDLINKPNQEFTQFKASYHLLKDKFHSKEVIINHNIKELKTREEALNKLKQKFNQLKAEKNKEFNESKAVLNGIKKDLESKEVLIDHNIQELKVKEEIHKLEVKLDEKIKELNDLRAVCNEIKVELESKDVIINENLDSIDKLNEKLSDDQNVIKDQKKNIELKNNLIDLKDGQINKNVELIDKLNEKLIQSNKTNEELKENLNKSNEMKSYYKKISDDLIIKVNSLEEKSDKNLKLINNLKASNSQEIEKLNKTIKGFEMNNKKLKSDLYNSEAKFKKLKQDLERSQVLKNDMKEMYFHKNYFKRMKKTVLNRICGESDPQTLDSNMSSIGYESQEMTSSSTSDQDMSQSESDEPLNSTINGSNGGTNSFGKRRKIIRKNKLFKCTEPECKTSFSCVKSSPNITKRAPLKRPIDLYKY